MSFLNELTFEESLIPYVINLILSSHKQQAIRSWAHQYEIFSDGPAERGQSYAETLTDWSVIAA